MKKIIPIALISVAMVFAACGQKEKEKEEATLYQCPMQCEGAKTYDKAGNCPVCGMELKPVEALVPAQPDSSVIASDSTSAV